MIQFDQRWDLEHICQMMVGPLKIMSKYWVLFSLAVDCEVIYCPNFRFGVPACQGLEANITACLLKNLNQAGGNPDD